MKPANGWLVFVPCYLRISAWWLLPVCLLGTTGIQAQNGNRNQFWNEFQFTRPLKGKWALETDIGQTWTSTPTKRSPFSESSQIYACFWGHFYANSRWKLSALAAYYYNRDVPEI